MLNRFQARQLIEASNVSVMHSKDAYQNQTVNAVKCNVLSRDFLA
jgi:hypothetical protein